MTADCLLCGPAEVGVWRRDRGFQVVECRNCALRFTFPHPTPEQLTAFYADGYYGQRGMDDSDNTDDNDRARIDQARHILDVAGTPVARVLDIGAGQGHLVAALRSLGLYAEGVEPFEGGRRMARARHGLELHTDLGALPPALFDLATFIHSLEHVPDPVRSVREASARLAPNGLVFIDVPHADSVEHWRPTRRSQILDLPGHLYHFTPATLTRIVERAGLSVVSVRLLNADILEWMLGLRARLPRSQGLAASSTGESSTAAVRASEAPTGLRARWRASILPWLRQHAPGWRFELLARKPLTPGEAS